MSFYTWSTSTFISGRYFTGRVWEKQVAIMTQFPDLGNIFRCGYPNISSNPFVYIWFNRFIERVEQPCTFILLLPRSRPDQERFHTRTSWTDWPNWFSRYFYSFSVKIHPLSSFFNFFYIIFIIKNTIVHEGFKLRLKTNKNKKQNTKLFLECKEWTTRIKRPFRRNKIRMKNNISNVSYYLFSISKTRLYHFRTSH